MKCELALTIFYFLGRAPSKVFFKSAGDRPPRRTRGFRDSTHHPRTVPLPDAVRDCPNERRIDSRDDRQRRHGPAGPVR